MRKSFFAIIASLLVAVLAWGATGGSGNGTVTPDGILVMQPATSNNCVAVRVEVPAHQMLTGVSWFNGSAAESFPQILVSTGRDFFPPDNQQAVVAATNVSGSDSTWTTVSFGEPIASETGTLFVVFKYSANYTPAADEVIHGLGYCAQEDKDMYFVTADGENWLKISSRYKLLIEPILAARDYGVVTLSESRPESSKSLTSAKQEMTFAAYPNPFNPEVKLELYLPEASPAKVKIYNVRGQMVRNLFVGGLEKGTNLLNWDGRDESGRQVSSGVYWAQVQTDSRTVSQRVALVK